MSPTSTAARSRPSTARSRTVEPVGRLRGSRPARRLRPVQHPDDRRRALRRLCQAERGPATRRSPGDGLGYRRRLRPERQLPGPGRDRRRPQRAVGPRAGARRTSASSAAICSSATSATAGSTRSGPPRRLGGARRPEGRRPPPDRDRRAVGHRVRQRRRGSGPPNTLFFAAGPDEETHGLFGSITAP